MVLDDRGGSEDHELIEVCPLTSTETIEMVQINPELEVKEREDIENLLQRFKDVLTTLPGYSKDEEHVINTTTSEPVRAKLYPIPYSQRGVIRKEVEEMMRMGIVRQSKSPYAAQPVLVRKPDGSMRFCVKVEFSNSFRW